jgi:hypothetical protein
MLGLFLSPGASLHLTGCFEKAQEWFLPKTAGRTKGTSPKGKGKKKETGKASPADKGKENHHGERRFSWKQAGIMGAIVAALTVFGAVTLSFSFGQLEYGIGMTKHKFSFKAADFLRANPIPGKMFNFFDIGGFLDWQLYPQALTFIDGRTYNQQVFLEHQTVTGGMQGWKEILNRHGITYIVTKTMDSSGMILPLIPVLANDPEWTLVFSDGLFVIFVRNLPENEAYRRKYGLSKAILPHHVIEESRHYVNLGVSPLVAYQNISTMYQLLGDIPAAVQALKIALETADVPFLRARLMQLERAAGGQSPPPKR